MRTFLFVTIGDISIHARHDLAHLLFSLALSVSKMVGCATTSTH